MEKGIYPDLTGTSEVGQDVKKFLHWWHFAAEHWFDYTELMNKVIGANSDDKEAVRSVIVAIKMTNASSSN